MTLTIKATLVTFYLDLRTAIWTNSFVFLNHKLQTTLEYKDIMITAGIIPTTISQKVELIFPEVTEGHDSKQNFLSTL